MPTDDIAALTRELTRLQVRVAQLEAAASPPSEAVTSTPHEPGPLGFKTGDRVRIRNKVKRPANWDIKQAWDQGAAQSATVTHTYLDQVHFLTDNGVATWRARNNLTLLED